MINWLKYSIVPLCICSVIFYVCCLIPIKDVPDIDWDWICPTDKIAHFLMFFGLSGATAFNYIYLKKGYVNLKKLIIGAFLLPIMYGGLIELIQHYFFPARSGDWYDFLADLLGSLTALLIVLFFRNYKIKNKFR